MAFQVVSVLVVAKTDGGYQHVYQGGFLPDGVDEVQLSQLIESGMVIEAALTASPEDEAPKPKSRGRG